MEPPTKTEKRETIVGGLFLQLCLLGIPFLSTALLKLHSGGNLPFVSALIHASGVLVVANLADLLIFDWLVFCTLTPRYAVIPGTEGHPAYKDYLFHFRAFLRGLAISVVLGLVAALITVIS